MGRKHGSEASRPGSGVPKKDLYGELTTFTHETTFSASPEEAKHSDLEKISTTFSRPIRQPTATHPLTARHHPLYHRPPPTTPPTNTTTTAITARYRKIFRVFFCQVEHPGRGLRPRREHRPCNAKSSATTRAATVHPSLFDAPFNALPGGTGCTVVARAVVELFGLQDGESGAGADRGGHVTHPALQGRPPRETDHDQRPRPPPG